MPAITSLKARQLLLAPTALAVYAAKSISTITRSGTTATATSTSHGLSVGDFVFIQGATNPRYNGLHQVQTSANGNTYTYTLAADPGANATLASATGIRTVATAIWGDGTTPAGYQSSQPLVSGWSPLSIGALATAMNGLFLCSCNNGATAPGAGPYCHVFDSATGTPGTWRQALPVPLQLYSPTNADVVPARYRVDGSRFVLGAFYGVTNQAVIVDAVGDEVTSYPVA